VRYLLCYSLFGLIFLFSCKNAKTIPAPTNELISIPNHHFSTNKYEITVEEFGKFVKQHNYTTTADSFKWSGVFSLEKNGWEPVDFANWQKPDGQNKAAQNHPVTHISYYDAQAYCKSKAGRLPTANEWDVLAGDSVIVGNVWQGIFPILDEGKDGYKTVTAPVGQFKANQFGLYDVFGNVWEWTNSQSPQGQQGQQIIKGGSFLCDYEFCSGFIPDRFQTTDKDSGLNHLGFRCVYDND